MPHSLVPSSAIRRCYNTGFDVTTRGLHSSTFRLNVLLVVSIVCGIPWLSSVTKRAQVERSGSPGLNVRRPTLSPGNSAKDAITVTPFRAVATAVAFVAPECRVVLYG